jgi:hypothetical protein
MEMQQDSPERRSEVRPDIEESHQAALLIDFDNVTMGIRSNLGQELRNLLNSDVIRGKVAVQRAYADWRRYFSRRRMAHPRRTRRISGWRSTLF